MHLVFYGDIGSGKVTINADGDRLTMKRRPDGSWEVGPSDAAVQGRAHNAIYASLGGILAHFAKPFPDGGPS